MLNFNIHIYNIIHIFRLFNELIKVTFFDITLAHFILYKTKTKVRTL